MGSVELEISPNKNLPNLPEEFTVDCITPGSIHLVFQTLLPVIFFSKKSENGFSLTIKGGAMVSFSPTFISQKFLFLPLLSKMGYETEYLIQNPGLSTLKMAQVNLKIPQSQQKLNPLILIKKGTIKNIKIYISLRY